MNQQVVETRTEPLTPHVFRSVMGSFPTGVTIISTTSESGADVGMTVNAITSVSLDPPQLLICLARSRYTAQAIESCGTFAVNFLSDDQEEVAGLFAASNPEKFKHFAVQRGELGMPLIANSLAVAECRLKSVVEAGDHMIFIGEVVSGSAGEGEPLVYFRRDYHALTTTGSKQNLG